MLLHGVEGHQISNKGLRCQRQMVERHEGLARSALAKTCVLALRRIASGGGTRSGRGGALSRYTEPEKDQLLLLRQLKVQLPAQPPPKITARNSREVAVSAHPVVPTLKLRPRDFSSLASPNPLSW
jgi:hypothetical protein